MTTPRGLLLSLATFVAFRCVTRFIRRASMYGRDSSFGQDDELRRDWIRDRLREVAGRY